MLIWVVYTLLSAFFFGLKDIVAKRLFREDMDPKQVVFEEFLLFLVLVLVLFFPLVEFSSFIFLWELYLLKAFAVAFAQISYLRMLKKYDLSTVSPLLNLSPLVLLVLSSIFLSEYISLVQFIGILIIIGSTYFLEVTIHHHRKEVPHKFHISDLKQKKFGFYILAFCTIFLFSLAALTDSLILDIVNVYTNLYFTSIIVFLVSIGYYLYEGEFKKVCKNVFYQPQTMIISIFAILSNFLILLAIAVPGALVSLIIPLRRTSTLISSLAGGILFHEKHIKEKFIATIFMLIGVILIVSTGSIPIE